MYPWQGLFGKQQQHSSRLNEASAAPGAPLQALLSDNHHGTCGGLRVPLGAGRKLWYHPPLCRVVCVGSHNHPIVQRLLQDGSGARGRCYWCPSRDLTTLFLTPSATFATCFCLPCCCDKPSRFAQAPLVFENAVNSSSLFATNKPLCRGDAAVTSGFVCWFFAAAPQTPSQRLSTFCCQHTHNHAVTTVWPQCAWRPPIPVCC